MNVEYTVIQYSTIVLFVSYDFIVLVQSGLLKPHSRSIYVNAVFYLLALLILIPFTFQLSHFCNILRNSLWHNQMLIALPSKSWSIIVSGFVGFLLLDFFHYLRHRNLHSSLFLMRIHGIHHLNDKINCTAVFKFQLFEVIQIQVLLYMVWTIFNVPYEGVLFYFLVVTVSGLWVHSHSASLRLPPGWNFFHKIVVTPNVHHIHHFVHARYYGRNFGVVLSCWDVMFGTYASPTETSEKAIEYGLPYIRESDCSLLRQLISLPFEKINYVGKKQKLIKPMELKNE